MSHSDVQWYSEGRIGWDLIQTQQRNWMSESGSSWKRWQVLLACWEVLWMWGEKRREEKEQLWTHTRAGTRAGTSYFGVVRPLPKAWQCIEARSADQSARSVKKNFHLHFSVSRMHELSRSTFVLCTALPLLTWLSHSRRGKENVSWLEG